MSTSDGTVVGTTQIVNNGPAAARWNLVIMGDGYQNAQLGQYANDAQGFVNTLIATPPFDALQHAVNVYRVDVTSTDAGADDPAACGGTGATPRTYFDATFCSGGIRRLLVVNNATALNVAAAQVPQFHMALVMVNSTVYGGSGGQVAVISRAAGADEIALHEMGHTAFHLADEYEYWAGCGADPAGSHDHHPAGEPAEPNVTTSANATGKWADLIAAGTARPTTQNANCAQCDPQASPVPAGTVGTFEGAHYYHCDAYRPEFNCRMRALGQPYCAVCRREISRTLTPFLPSTWSDWLSEGGVLTSRIAIGNDADGRLETFVRGTDNALWHKWQVAPNSGWSDWLSEGGVLTSDIAVGRNADGRLEVFVRGTDAALWHKWQVAPNSGWSDWLSEGGALTSDIAVGSNQDGRLEVFARGTDNALWHKWQVAPNSGWSDWLSEGGVLTSEIAIGSNADGRMEVYVRGTDNALWHKWQVTVNGGWSGWLSEGGVLTSNIAVGRNSSGRLEVFVRGTDNALWHKWQNAPNSSWSGWESLGGVLISDAAVGSNQDGRLEVFAQGTDQAMWHIWQRTPQ